MQDRPDAPELLEAVAAYLFAELRPQAPREQRFKVLVAANVCAVVARELRAGDEPDREDLAAFTRLLGGEVIGGADARAAGGELAARIRAGELDSSLPEVIAEMREHARRKLEITRPGYAG
jgi:hypothetical protein